MLNNPPFLKNKQVKILLVKILNIFLVKLLLFYFVIIIIITIILNFRCPAQAWFLLLPSENVHWKCKRAAH